MPNILRISLLLVTLAVLCTACNNSLDIDTPRKSLVVFPGIPQEGKARSVKPLIADASVLELQSEIGGEVGIIGPWHYSRNMWDIRVDTSESVPKLWLALDLAASAGTEKEGIIGARLRLNGLSCSKAYHVSGNPFVENGFEVTRRRYSETRQEYDVEHTYIPCRVELEYRKQNSQGDPEIKGSVSFLEFIDADLALSNPARTELRFELLLRFAPAGE